MRKNEYASNNNQNSEKDNGNILKERQKFKILIVVSKIQKPNRKSSYLYTYIYEHIISTHFSHKHKTIPTPTTTGSSVTHTHMRTYTHRTQTLEQIQTTLLTLTTLIPTSHTHNAQLFIGLDFKHNFNNVIVSQSNKSISRQSKLSKNYTNMRF